MSQQPFSQAVVSHAQALRRNGKFFNDPVHGHIRLVSPWLLHHICSPSPSSAKAACWQQRDRLLCQAWRPLLCCNLRGIAVCFDQVVGTTLRRYGTATAMSAAVRSQHRSLCVLHKHHVPWVLQARRTAQSALPAPPLSAHVCLQRVTCSVPSQPACCCRAPHVLLSWTLPSSRGSETCTSWGPHPLSSQVSTCSAVWAQQECYLTRPAHRHEPLCACLHQQSQALSRCQRSAVTVARQASEAANRHTPQRTLAWRTQAAHAPVDS